MKRVGLSNADLEMFNDFDAEQDYDGEDYYDEEENATGSAPISNINMQIISTANTDVKIEIFNWLNSFLKKQNRNIVSANMTAAGFLHIPYASFQGMQRITAAQLKATTVTIAALATPTNLTTVAYGTDTFVPGLAYIDADGKLIMTGANALTDASGSGQVTVQLNGSNMDYYKLLEWSAKRTLKIKGFRFKFTNADQIDQDLELVKVTPTGGNKGNSISPSAFFRPEQQQSLIVDVPVSATVTPDSGFQYNVVGRTGATPGLGTNVINISIFLTA